MQHVKLVLVGASGEIMTELMVALRPLSNEFAANPEFDQTGDNAFQPFGEYDRLRPLSYPRTDVFAVAYDPYDARSFDLVESKWIPEIHHHCPSTPVAILELHPSQSGGSPVVTEAQGNELARKLEAIGWFSYRTTEINERFSRDILEAVLARWQQRAKKTKDNARCIVS